MQPVNYAEVAEALDGLKVAHAMVLLRELEVQAPRIEDPTEHIQALIRSAGGDDVNVSNVVEGGQETAVAQRVDALNASGALAKPIEYAELAEDLARIGEDAAMGLLQEVEDKGRGVKDPTGYIRFKLKAKLASLGASLEDTVDDETKILKRIEWLNDYGGLAADIDYNQVAPSLEAIGIDHAMTVLKELEDQRRGTADPTGFIKSAIVSSKKKTGLRAPAAPPAPAMVLPASTGRSGVSGRRARTAQSGSGGTDFQMLSGLVTLLNKSSRSKAQVNFAEIASALDALGPQRALRVIQEMQEKGLGLDDPVAYIKSKAAVYKPSIAQAQEEEEDADDVQKLTKKITWLNDFGCLQKKIRTEAVVGALYCLGLPQSMAILKGLQQKAAQVPDPTAYIKIAVQRANGVRVAPAAKAEVDQDDADEEMDESEALAAEAELNEEEEDEPEDLATLANMGMDAAEEDWYTQVEEPEPVTKVSKPTRVAKQEPGVQEEPEDGEELEEDDGPAPRVWPNRAQPKLTAVKKAPTEMRVVGAVKGMQKLVPTRPPSMRQAPEATRESVVEPAPRESDHPDPDQETEQEPRPPSAPKPSGAMPISPQEKIVQIRNMSVKIGLNLDQNALKCLARLPFYRARDLLDEVQLGGRNRAGVNNPSKYISIACQKMSVGLGVEQGLAMELAVSVGVVLNNEALDELASIPRKEAHSVIREVARNPEARMDPIDFIRDEVRRCRAEMDAKPWPPTAAAA